MKLVNKETWASVSVQGCTLPLQYSGNSLPTAHLQGSRIGFIHLLKLDR